MVAGLSIGCVIALAGTLLLMATQAARDADEVNHGYSASFRVLAFPLTAWSAKVALLDWKQDAALRERPRCALFLGQSDGVDVLVIRNPNEEPHTLRVPAGDVAVTLTDAETCRAWAALPSAAVCGRYTNTSTNGGGIRERFELNGNYGWRGGRACPAVR